MPNLAIEQLAPAVAAGLQPLYVIHGEEDLLRVEALDTLRAAAKQHGYLNREVYTVENGFDWQELLASAGSVGLFADLKLLEIHIPNGKTGKTGSEALQLLAERLPSDTVVVLMLPKLERAQTQAKWFTALAKVGVVLEAKPITGQQLPNWLRQRLQHKGLEIELEALNVFAERVEGNLLAAKQEIDKLALLYGQGHLLTIAEAEQAVANVARFDVFQLAGAWMSGDVARTVHLLDGLAAEGEEPVLLLWAVAEDIRTLIRLKGALQQGQSVQAVRHGLRLWGEKQTFAPRAAQRIKIQQLIAALQECARIDRMIKGAEEGDAWAAFRQLVSGLAV